MTDKRSIATLAVAGLLALAGLGVPRASIAHPLGNFSISQYGGIRINPDVIELRYLVDMAEIPTFQEIQDTGIVPEAGHPALKAYLARKVEQLKEGLLLEVDGRRLSLEPISSDVIFPPGAGGLPTLKLGLVYRARLPSPPAAGPSHLAYRDGNFPDRAGWKEIIAVGGAGVTLTSRSVPEKDRSQELADYPTDLLNSPPQDLEARIVFTRDGGPVLARVESNPPASGSGGSRPEAPAPRPEAPPAPPAAAVAAPARAPAAPPGDGQPAESPQATLPPSTAAAEAPAESAPLRLQGNRQETPRSAFTDLVTTRELSVGVVLIGLAVAASLGAFHALEPGHGKTVVAAYLVGSRGTAWHAFLLGLTVTASHTAGVYLLGAVTLYASRYVVPERLYPWLGAASGLAIAILGFTLFLRRYAGQTHPHTHGHSHDHGHGHHHHGPTSHSHGPEHVHDGHDHQHEPDRSVSLPALLALGVTGGIVPCPAALVVLLSAISLNRIGFGLLLIVAFSVGLAAVLIAIGILMVYARRFMTRFRAEGPLIHRWLPLTSSAVITILGVVIAVQALMSAGILQIRLG